MTDQQALKIESMTRAGTDIVAVKFVGVSIPIGIRVDELAAAGITPPKPDINFDELPVGSVVSTGSRLGVVKRADGRWVSTASGSTVNCGDWKGARITYLPAAPDKRTALHALNLTDEDIANASQGVTGYPPPWLVKVCDAAREAEAQR